MPKSIRQRVDDAFSKDDVEHAEEIQEHAEKLQEITLSSMRQLSDAVTRAVVTVFVLAAVFELLVNSTSVKSFTPGPVSFSDTSLLQQFIPALIAYLLYDAYSLVTRWRSQADIYNAITRRFQPILADSQQMVHVLPVIRGPWPFGLRTHGENERPSDKFARQVNVIIALFGILVLPLAFELQAYAALIHKYGATNILVWVSMVAAVFFMAVWLIRMRIDFFSA